MRKKEVSEVVGRVWAISRAQAARAVGAELWRPALGLLFCLCLSPSTWPANPIGQTHLSTAATQPLSSSSSTFL